MSKSVTREQIHHVRDHCLCLHAQRAARALARRFDEALKPLGLTNGQFSLLMALNRPDPPPVGSVSALLGMDRTTVTAKLKPLQRRGLIIVTPDPNDQRSRHLALTELGRETLARAFPVWQRTHADVERILDDPDAATLRRGLAKISAGAARSASANGA